jgi:hypothetical protein
MQHIRLTRSRSSLSPHLAWSEVLLPHEQPLCVLAHIKQPGIPLTQQGQAAGAAVTRCRPVSSTTHERERQPSTVGLRSQAVRT